MGRRGHRQGLPGGFEPQLAAAAHDRRELAQQALLSHRAQVQPDVAHVMLLHVARQGTAHLIPRRQVGASQMGHGALAAVVAQSGPFAAHRFRDQEMGCTGKHQCGGMKLHEFQVLQLGARLPGHHQAIAAGLGGVGGVGEEMTAPTGGKHHRPGRHPADHAVDQELETLAAPPLHPESQHHHALALHQARPPPHLPLQGIHQGTTGAVLGMEDAPVAVGGLQGGTQACSVAIEGHAQFKQPLHAGRRLMHQQFHGVAVAEAGTGPDGVLDVAGEAVTGGRHRGNPALGPAAGRTGLALLAEQQHAQMVGQFQAGHQAGGAAAHHHHVPELVVQRIPALLLLVDVSCHGCRFLPAVPASKKPPVARRLATAR